MLIAVSVVAAWAFANYHVAAVDWLSTEMLSENTEVLSCAAALPLHWRVVGTRCQLVFGGRSHQECTESEAAGTTAVLLAAYR